MGPRCTILTALTLSALLCCPFARSAHADGFNGGLVEDPGFHDGYEEKVAYAMELYAAQRFEDALIELRAAYELRQSPDLLFLLGRTARKLGRASLAIDYYQRFLATQSDIYSPRYREAREALRDLHLALTLPVDEPPPRPASRPPPARRGREVRGNDSLLTGGLVCLLLGGTAAALGGATFAIFGSSYGSYDTIVSERAAGELLLVPVLGPVLSAGLYPKAGWAVPWALLDGGAQLSGLVMIVAGSLDRRLIAPSEEESRLHFTPWLGGSGAGLTVSGRF